MTAPTLTRLDVPLDANWRLKGLCLTEDPDLMHPADRDLYGQNQAKAICFVCPVKAQCLKDAIDTDDWNGIRGGMTPKERRNYASGGTGHVCTRCGDNFVPRMKHQKRCSSCVVTNDGHHYGAERRLCRACGTNGHIDQDTGQLGRHKVPGKSHSRPYCAGEPTETEQREDYLHQINRCEHRPEWRQPGGLCGGCGKDDFAEMEKAA